MFLVECLLTDEFRKHVNFTTRKNIDGRYYFNVIYTYECIFGYEKAVEDVIQCGVHGTWTASLNCTQKGKPVITLLIS